MTCATLLWFAPGFVRDAFAAIFARPAAFCRDCGVLRDGALRRGHQSVAHMEGDVQCTCAAFSSSAAVQLLHSL